jgi:hypothetical protein
LAFQDENYSLYNYRNGTNLLIDRKNHLNLCFIYNDIYKDTIRKRDFSAIYLLDKELMPEFSIHYMITSDIIQIDKFHYDDKLNIPYGSILELKSNISPNLNQLDYSKIIYLMKDLRKGNFRETNKKKSYYSPHFNDTPVWTEN